MRVLWLPRRCIERVPFSFVYFFFPSKGWGRRVVAGPFDGDVKNRLITKRPERFEN